MIDPELDAIRRRKLQERMNSLGKKEVGEMNKVIVYSTTTCPYCHMAKDYLRGKNVEFEDVNVGADPARAQEMMQKSGQMGVPVLDIKGNIIVGFDREAIDRALSG